MKLDNCNPKVSIIVPVYNIECFIKRCIDSIIAQTYANLEIVLVNDGSTDNSGEICASYQVVDARIVVIKKKNGGLSDARNAGIERATGDYIAFVDGDDYVCSYYVEHLLFLILKNDVQVAMCQYVEIYSKSLELQKFTQDSCGIEIYTGEEALVELLYQRNVSTSACCKLFCRSLFETLRFPIGMLYEDFAICYELYTNTQLVAVSSAKMYGYYQRSDSIIHSQLSSKNFDLLTLSEEIVLKAARQPGELLKAAKTRQFSSCCSVLRLLLDSPYKVYDKEKLKIWKRIRELRWDILKNKNSRFKNKLAAFFTFSGKHLFCNIILRIYRGTMLD